MTRVKKNPQVNNLENDCKKNKRGLLKELRAKQNEINSLIKEAKEQGINVMWTDPVRAYYEKKTPLINFSV